MSPWKGRTTVAALQTRGLYANGVLTSTSIAEASRTDAANAEFIFEQAGERAVSETFRLWPTMLPDTQRGMKALVTDCDLYAADPNDPQRQVPGVSNGLVNVRRGSIEGMFPSKVSMMPTGLLNTLSRDEVLDLMAYLLSRGDRNHPMFRKE